MVRAWLITARSIVCRIHHVAYVEKRKPRAGIELLQRVDQAQVALLDEVEQRETAVGVVLGNRHDEPQVAFDHRLPGGEVARERLHRGVVLFLGRHQAMRPDRRQVALDVVGVGQIERNRRLRDRYRAEVEFVLGARDLGRKRGIVGIRGRHVQALDTGVPLGRAVCGDMRVGQNLNVVAGI